MCHHVSERCRIDYSFRLIAEIIKDLRKSFANILAQSFDLIVWLYIFGKSARSQYALCSVKRADLEMEHYFIIINVYF